MSARRPRGPSFLRAWRGRQSLLRRPHRSWGYPRRAEPHASPALLAYHTGLSFKAVRYKGEEFAVRKLMEDGRERTRNDIGNALGIDPEVAARIGRKLYGDGVLDMEFFDSSTPIYRMKEAS